jgi:hypothetical protein
MTDYLDKFSSFDKEVLRLDSPHFGPLFLAPLLPLDFLEEGEFVHQHAIETHSQRHNIAFLALEFPCP